MAAVTCVLMKSVAMVRREARVKVQVQCHQKAIKMWIPHLSLTLPQKSSNFISNRTP